MATAQQGIAGHPDAITVTDAAGTVIIADANTTIAYCRYTEAGEIEYLFVNSAHRRRGYASRVLAMVEVRVGRRLRFQPPLSPLGARLLQAYEQDADGRAGSLRGRALMDKAAGQGAAAPGR